VYIYWTGKDFVDLCWTDWDLVYIYWTGKDFVDLSWTD